MGECTSTGKKETQSVVLSELLQDLVGCSICLEQLSDPRLLPCGHSFCLTCLESWVAQRNLTCPTCRQKVYVDLTNLPKDFKALLLQDSINRQQGSKEKTTKYKQRMCNQHSAKVVDLYCTSCEEMICSKCSVGPKHRRHAIQDVDDQLMQLEEKLEGIRSHLVRLNMTLLENQQLILMEQKAADKLISGTAKNWQTAVTIWEKKMTEYVHTEILGVAQEENCQKLTVISEIEEMLNGIYKQIGVKNHEGAECLLQNTISKLQPSFPQREGVEGETSGCPSSVPTLALPSLTEVELFQSIMKTMGLGDRLNAICQPKGACKLLALPEKKKSFSIKADDPNQRVSIQDAMWGSGGSLLVADSDGDCIRQINIWTGEAVGRSGKLYFRNVVTSPQRLHSVPSQTDNEIILVKELQNCNSELAVLTNSMTKKTNLSSIIHYQNTKKSWVTTSANYENGILVADTKGMLTWYEINLLEESREEVLRRWEVELPTIKGSKQSRLVANYMVADDPTGLLVVSSFHAGLVYCMDLRQRGRLVWMYSELKWPTGVTIDSHGLVLVCSLKSNNKQQGQVTLLDLASGSKRGELLRTQPMDYCLPRKALVCGNVYALIVEQSGTITLLKYMTNRMDDGGEVAQVTR